jgi:uncharacterized membrane protein YqiK
MDFSNKKYIKYKTKYVELKGGMYNRLEDFDYEPDEKQIQKLEQLEKDRLEKDRLERVAEKERLEREKVAEKERLEREKVAEKERVERLAEKERLERVAEKERLEKVAEKERVDKNMEYLKKIGNEARDKENAMKEFITVLDRIDINKIQLLEEIENVLKKDNVENKNKLLTVLQKYKEEINNKKLAINKIKEVYDYIPSDIKQKIVFETILR